MEKSQVKGAKLLTPEEQKRFAQFMEQQWRPTPTKLAIKVAEHLHEKFKHIETAQKVRLRKVHAACMDAFAQAMRDAGVPLPGNLNFMEALRQIQR